MYVNTGAWAVDPVLNKQHQQQLLKGRELSACTVTTNSFPTAITRSGNGSVAYTMCGFTLVNDS